PPRTSVNRRPETVFDCPACREVFTVVVCLIWRLVGYLARVAVERVRGRRGSCGSSPSLASSSNFRPAFSDFGPPSMGFVQPVKVSQGSTYSELLSVIEEMSREIRPTYAGSKSAMERLKRGIIHARALVRECLAETERSART
uniref:Cyclin-dependent kinase 2 associated protein 2 n=2 Tax=Cyprinus carpio TaxID=7962 RepID=A0A8C1VH85_CYPCA